MERYLHELNFTLGNPCVKGQGQKSAPEKKSVLVVDDHPMMREGLRQLISKDPAFDVCAEADDAAAALTLAEKFKPDLAIVDISLKASNGIELIKDMRIRSPKTDILVLSMHDESLYAERVLRAGGRGYIMKQEGGRRILEGLRHVAEGKTFVSETIAARILDNYSGRAAGASPVEQLTDREFEVFQLIGQGLNTKEMAERMHVSVKTIEVHRVNIKNKLGTPTVSDLIRFAVRWMESQAGSRDSD